MGSSAVTMQARRAARPWVGPVARIGMATKGVVYLLVGGMAVRAAAGRGGHVEDTRGAVENLGRQPFGDGLLVAVGAGLALFALWRVMQAILNLDGARGLKGAGKRAGYAVSAAVYGGLAAAAFQLAFGEHASGGGSRIWAARVLAQPFGAFVLGAVGVGVAVYGLVHLWHAVTAHFCKHMDLSRLGRRARTLVTWVGRAGTAARGVVFCVAGYHVVRAAVLTRPSEAKTSGGALRTLAEAPHGTLLLGGTAAGLFLYGAFMLVRARLERVPGSADGGGG
ncbi:MAG TPA: DUF1206 domain-containing protein [Kofleriaceae bacterium]|nr:DUF1206 domain-containing protein [Kofleriaceae bacterium]